MARYLTPSKISLLCLISLYTDCLVPTSAVIPILSFIVSHLIPLETPNSSHNSSSLSPRSFIITIADIQKACSNFPSGVPGRSLWDLLLKRLWEINSFDALHVFFDRLNALLVKTREEQQKDAEQGMVSFPSNRILLSRTSPLGTFIRRAQLEFLRIQFHDAVSLWKSFIGYRQPTWATWRKRNPLAGRESFDVNLDGDVLHERLTNAVYGRDPGRAAPMEGEVSTDDLERLLEFQVDEMQKLGNRIPSEVKTQFRSMLESNIAIPSLSHYVKFLDSWRAGDYPSSFDHLHRYFDYTMQNRDRTFYQYALLNLAILQADFGCYSEAVAAMQETISAARENKDMGCLNFSLSWLYHFGKAHPNEVGGVGKRGMMSIEREGLAFLKTKAKETGMWSLWSTSLLSEAKLNLSNGESVPTAFENIVKSSHINVVKGMNNVVGSQMLLQSTLWSRLGVTHLAWSYCDMFLQCYAGQAPFDDVLKCICRSAYIMAQTGRHDEALAKLQEVDSEWLRNLRTHQYWAIFSGLLRLKRELHRNNLRAAEHLHSQLLAQDPTEPDIAFEIKVLEIDLLMRRGSHPMALSKLETLSSKLAEDDADIYHRVRLLNLKAHILSKCGVPLKGFSVAVRAAGAAWRARILPALWDSLCAVADSLLHLREFDAAFKLLSAITPQVLECEDAALSARSYSLLATAQMGLAGQATHRTPKRKEHLTKAIGFIDMSFDEYSRIEDIQGQAEMIAKKATIMHLVGDLELANDYAAKYLDLKKQWQADLE